MKSNQFLGRNAGFVNHGGLSVVAGFSPFMVVAPERLRQEHCKDDEARRGTDGRGDKPCGQPEPQAA